jgi:hypothetical protein
MLVRNWSAGNGNVERPGYMWIEIRVSHAYIDQPYISLEKLFHQKQGFREVGMVVFIDAKPALIAI